MAEAALPGLSRASMVSVPRGRFRTLELPRCPHNPLQTNGIRSVQLATPSRGLLGVCTV